jgi:hypothetical protein
VLLAQVCLELRVSGCRGGQDALVFLALSGLAEVPEYGHDRSEDLRIPGEAAATAERASFFAESRSGVAVVTRSRSSMGGSVLSSANPSNGPGESAPSAFRVDSGGMTPSSRVGVIINPAEAGAVLALLPDQAYRRVTTWMELLDLLHEHSAELFIDPKEAEQIIRILNGNP